MAVLESRTINCNMVWLATVHAETLTAAAFLLFLCESSVEELGCAEIHSFSSIRCSAWSRDRSNRRTRRGQSILGRDGKVAWNILIPIVVAPRLKDISKEVAAGV